MSAFVVDPKTINRIMRLIRNQSREHWITTDEYCQKYFCASDMPNLGQAMYDLNIKAVNQRYPDTVGHLERCPGTIDPETGALADYAYGFDDCGTIQAIKSLECWLYQCSEGDIPNEYLFKAMEKMLNRCYASVVGNLPEYKAAKWD
jgi:hypothetical protein